MKFYNTPIENVSVGDVIKVTKPYKDTEMTLKGEVTRILSEGLVRTLYTGEGVELAQYVIGKCHGQKIEMIKQHNPHSELPL